MSRISGYGGGYGPGLGGQQRHRADQFRARHQVGERLRGRILRLEPGGLTLVEVDGQELTARLEVPAEPGDTMFFIVRALLPEIHLQALQGGLSNDPASLLQQFRTARQHFEQRAASLLAALPFDPSTFLPPSSLPAPFRALLDLPHGGDPSLADLYDETQARLARLDLELARPRGRAAHYTPWTTPGLTRAEALLTSGQRRDYIELAASGHLPRYGDYELRLVGRRPAFHLRLWLERPEHAAELAELVREALGPGSGELTSAGLGSPVPGGVFGELLAEGGMVSGGLNARV